MMATKVLRIKMLAIGKIIQRPINDQKIEPCNELA